MKEGLPHPKADLRGNKKRTKKGKKWFKAANKRQPSWHNPS